MRYSLHFSRKTAEIAELIVDVKTRGRGIGKMILIELTRIAVENECARIEVASNRQRPDAHRFYMREGFACTHYKFTKKLE